MAWENNPFTLLAEYDDGGDVTTLLAKLEAKIAAAAMQGKQPSEPKPPADWLPSKPRLPPAQYVRAENDGGRGGRGRGLWRGGFRSGSSGDADGDLVVGYTRGLGSDFRRRGRGRAGERGGRGRGKGRGFHEGRGFDNENHYDAGVENQGKGGDKSGEGIDVQGKNNDLVENHEPRYDGDYRRFGGGGGRRGRGIGFGFVGGRGGFRGGGVISLRYVVKEPKSQGQNESHNRESTPNEKGQIGDNASGWDMPATTYVPKGELHNADQNQLSAAKSLEKNPNEEDNEMTLDEYEKVVQEKRKALESLKNQERKVVLDKDFENMRLVEKKKEDDFIKLRIGKEKLKRQRSFEKEEKVRKAVSINEFLKPAEGERFYGPLSGRGRADGRGGGRGVRGGFRAGYTGRGGHDVPEVLRFEDPVQFPLLGATAKA